MSMPEVVDTDPAEIGGSSYGLPWTFEIGPGSVVFCTCILAGNYVRANSWEISKNVKGRGIQNDGFLAGFAVRQEEHASFEVHMLPFQMQDFAQPRAREDQQPDGGRSMWSNQGSPVFLLRGVLRGWFGFVDQIGVCTENLIRID
jgi:hypothetical protein